MKILFLICFIASGFSASASSEITQYKFTEKEYETGMPHYDIPASSRFTTARAADAPDIIYYLSKPTQATYPIAILCTGSTSRDSIASIIHFHRYFLKEFLDLGAAVLTVEQWGVDGNAVDKDEFMRHYTRTQRRNDHIAVIEHLKSNHPAGWNGQFVFLGVSEGGPLVTTLTTLYQDCTIATINWSGAGDWNWREELWAFIQKLPPQATGVSSRADYDARMDKTLEDPTPDKEFLSMTYKYHEDALTYPIHNYKNLRTPFLVVSGTKDCIIESSDLFVEKTKAAWANITYLRVEDMDHYVRRRIDVIAQSFAWLLQQLLTSSGVTH